MLFNIEKWQVERLPEGRYILKNFEAPVTARGGHVKAVIYPNVDETLKIFEWHITLQHHKGEKLYTIASLNGECFWHTTSDTFSPIAVGPVDAYLSDPPQFEKNALFRFEPVTLKSGIYTIHNEFSPVGRALFEDFSPNPKPVYNATDAARSLWYIQAEKNGKYKLLNLGAPVAPQEDELFAFIDPDLDPNDPKFEWTIEPRFYQGRFLYTSVVVSWLSIFTNLRFSLGSRSLAIMDGLQLPTSFLRIVPFVLRSGFYKIRHHDGLVGRASIEDKSLRPKRILNKTDNPDATWFIQNVGPNRYKLSASQGFDVVSLDYTNEKFRGYDPVDAEVRPEEQQGPFFVFAVVEPKFVGPDWSIIPRFIHGEDVYTIQLASLPSIFLDRFWFAHEREKSQIEIKNVLFENGVPPDPNLLFKIDPLPVPIREGL
ncbi:hypothetical protein Clacol_002144 [Clathrus columnatus]|uniref:Uncharacterized protein n=1 Tax=Clathrus columnatus TaxID=1419009 RepID=A0AAV4ZZX0_9AGAM|nr:hypothetical protein Clacol_002144 [Clathrus columnatus]